MNDSKSVTKDPVCGMSVDEATALRTERDGTSYFFCSEHCQKRFMATPATPAGTRPEGS